jgi:hypothetical protein
MISWWLGQPPGNIFVKVMGKSPDEGLSSCHGAALARDVAPIGASAGSIGSMIKTLRTTWVKQTSSEKT